MFREASFYTVENQGVVRCRLCPIGCVLRPAGIGICGTRQNVAGRMHLLNYGQVSACHVDPIEKKPLYHFLPGASILSLGNSGCNLKCAFCQNWQISQSPVETETMDPGDVLHLVKKLALNSVAFTYAEPSVWFEFVLDTAKVLHENDIKVVLVTNGLINEEPFRALGPWIDAMNIDIKSMDSDFYTRLCKGPLEPVLKTCIRAVEFCHLEITNLIIPGENDADRNFHDLSRFIRDNLGVDIPLHLSRYHPAYNLKNPSTPLETMTRAFDIARQYLHFVYLGNVNSPAGNSTVCPQCKNLLIERSGPSDVSVKVPDGGVCPNCAYRTGIIVR